MSMPRKGLSRKDAEPKRSISSEGPARANLVLLEELRPFKDYIRRNSHTGSVLRIVARRSSQASLLLGFISTAFRKQSWAV